MLTLIRHPTTVIGGKAAAWSIHLRSFASAISASGTKQTCSVRRWNVRFWGQNGRWPTAAYQSRFMGTRPWRLDCLLCRDPRHVEGPPLQLAPIWDSGWGQHTARRRGGV